MIRSIARSVDRPIDRSVDRSIARAFDRSVARTVAQSLGSHDRSLDSLPGSSTTLADDIFRGFKLRFIDMLRHYLAEANFELIARAIIISQLSEFRCFCSRELRSSIFIIKYMMQTVLRRLNRSSMRCLKQSPLKFRSSLRSYISAEIAAFTWAATASDISLETS